MQEKITPHLREQARTNSAIKLQFYKDPQDIDNIAKYIAGNPHIDDVILSGGDPLYTPKLQRKFYKN